MNPLRTTPPVPPDFAEVFVKGGWRLAERLYGASTPVLQKWIAMSGGRELHARRAAEQQCGPRSGGSPAVNIAPVAE